MLLYMRMIAPSPPNPGLARLCTFFSSAELMLSYCFSSLGVTSVNTSLKISYNMNSTPSSKEIFQHSLASMSEYILFMQEVTKDAAIPNRKIIK
mmetsp:Transcript_35091/g.46343  ORF Transcript_35091/g.46343 Transcript_35091/m.46343 type:complete len:94 (-) Transcript_35091:231-512(-)